MPIQIHEDRFTLVISTSGVTSVPYYKEGVGEWPSDLSFQVIANSPFFMQVNGTYNANAREEVSSNFVSVSSPTIAPGFYKVDDFHPPALQFDVQSITSGDLLSVIVGR